MIGFLRLLLAWWSQVFLRSFAHYLIFPTALLLILVLLLAPLWNIGANYGVPDAITAADTYKHVFVAFSLGVLWLTALYGGYLLWLKDCRDGRVLPPTSWTELTNEKRGRNADPDAGIPQPAQVVGFSCY